MPLRAIGFAQSKVGVNPSLAARAAACARQILQTKRRSVHEKGSIAKPARPHMENP